MRQGGVKSNADSIGMQFSQVSSQASQAPAKQSVFARLPKSVGAEHMRAQALSQSSVLAQMPGRASPATAHRAELGAQPTLRSSGLVAQAPMTESRHFASSDRKTLSLVASSTSSRVAGGALASLPSTVSEGKPVAHEQARQSLLAQPIGAGFMAAPLPSDKLQQTELALIDREAISTENAPSISSVSSIPAAWKVTDTAAAKAEMTEWVRTKDGTVMVNDAQHLTITLPASAMTDFVRRFPMISSSSTEFEAWRINAPASSPVGIPLPATAPVTSQVVPQASTPQVTISLELVPLQ